MAYYAEPRFTKYLDVLVCISAPDHLRLHDCLKAFGAPVGITTPEEFLQEDFIFHFGNPPWRVDILTSAPGVDFEAAYAEREPLPLGEYQASCISRKWLIKSKRASGRPQDLLDLAALGG